MRRNGDLSAASPAPSTPRPPMKKQKINNPNNSPHPKHTPHRIPNSYRPSPKHIIFNEDDFNDVTPKIKMSKLPKSGGSAKPWKPKRAVPTSGDPLPPSKLVVDEADDFPRGGGPQENKGAKMKKRKYKTKQVPLSVPDGDWRPDNVWRTGGKGSQGPKSKAQTGEKKRWKNRSLKTAKRQLGRPTYSEEDNLFLIKQRKRSR